ncbi:MAG: FtsL-like putative cell division protein [Bacteroidales bacterium]|nr:FtsL-like putative cell division protein [Bacteroidales bacterium]
MAFGFKKKKGEVNQFENESKSLSVKEIFDGKAVSEFLKKQVGLIAIVLAFLFFYISNRYECQQRLVDIVKLEKKLTDVKYEALTRSSELMGGSKQSQVKQLIVEKGINLEESETPPYSITKQAEEK